MAESKASHFGEFEIAGVKIPIYYDLCRKIFTAKKEYEVDGITAEIGLTDLKQATLARKNMAKQIKEGYNMIPKEINKKKNVINDEKSVDSTVLSPIVTLDKRKRAAQTSPSLPEKMTRTSLEEIQTGEMIARKSSGRRDNKPADAEDAPSSSKNLYVAKDNVLACTSQQQSIPFTKTKESTPRRRVIVSSSDDESTNEDGENKDLIYESDSSIDRFEPSRPKPKIKKKRLSEGLCEQQRLELKQLKKEKCFKFVVKELFGKNCSDAMKIDYKNLTLSKPTYRKCIKCDGRWFKVIDLEPLYTNKRNLVLVCWNLTCGTICERNWTKSRVYTHYGVPSKRLIQYGVIDFWNQQNNRKYTEWEYRFYEENFRDLSDWYSIFPTVRKEALGITEMSSIKKPTQMYDQLGIWPTAPYLADETTQMIKILHKSTYGFEDLSEQIVPSRIIKNNITETTNRLVKEAQALSTEKKARNQGRNLGNKTDKKRTNQSKY